MKVKCEACQTIFEPVIKVVTGYNKEPKYDMLNQIPVIECHVCGRRYYPIAWKSDRPLTIIES